MPGAQYVANLSKCNTCWTRRKDIALSFIKEEFETGDCAYHIIDGQRVSDHLRRLSKAGIDASVMDALLVHPAVIIGGILQENPFYVLPMDFPRELRERDLSCKTA
jgi:hypothetical protein